MNELAVVVLSCDKYKDAWHPFYHFFKKFWSDCPFPVYHISETIEPKVDFKINFIPVNHSSWSFRLLASLDKIQSNYILVLLEDYFLLKPVDNKRMEKCIEILKKENAGCLRIFPCPGPNGSFKNYEDVGWIDLKENNALNSQATIWDKNILKDLLNENESVWQFEQHINALAEKSGKNFLCVKIKGDRKRLENGNYPYTYLCTAIVQGKWAREAVKLCKKENISLDINYRNKQTILESYFYRNYSDLSPFLRKLLFVLIRK